MRLNNSHWRTAALTLAAACVFATPAVAAGQARLVIDNDFPDPDVMEHSGTLYAYATNSGRNIPTATATQTSGPWAQQPDALPSDRLPAWVGPSPNGSLNIWAPDVSQRLDGSFLMYYSAFHAATHRQCIGAAVADNPLGPFTPTGPDPLICESDQGNVIDPQSFVDSDGSRYVLFKDSRGTLAKGGPSIIRMRPVADDGLTQLGPDMALIRDDRPEEASTVEGPTLVRRPEGYVLFYSANMYNSGHYFINYATAPSLSGPFTKADGALISKETTGGTITDPGGQDIVPSPEGDHIVFHGDLSAPGGPRGMYEDRLSWDGLRPIVGG